MKVHVFHDGQHHVLESGGADGGSRFGGAIVRPLDEGKVTAAAVLHNIVTIGPADSAAMRLDEFGGGMSLVAPMRHDGTWLEYEHGATLVVRRVSELVTDGSWPYPGFPDEVPELPLQLVESRPSTREQFSQLAPNLEMDERIDLFVLLPTPCDIGFSLWGPEGDAEEVALAWFCEAQSGLIRVCNLCT